MEENINEVIINEAVKRLKEGKIKNNMDVENFVDSLIQPLYQKMLDTELENMLDYAKYEHKKDNNNSRNGYCKSKKVQTKYGTVNKSQTLNLTDLGRIRGERATGKNILGQIM